MKKKKVINLAEYRRKGVAPSLDEVARLAALRYFDPVILANNKEPIDLVSGKTFDGGSFVPHGADESDDEVGNARNRGVGRCPHG